MFSCVLFTWSSLSDFQPAPLRSWSSRADLPAFLPLPR